MIVGNLILTTAIDGTDQGTSESVWYLVTDISDSRELWLEGEGGIAKHTAAIARD